MLSQTPGPVDTATDRILDAAQQAIVESGFTAATVSGIAQRAGVSRMTVYRKFADRREILSALFTRELGGIVHDAARTEAPTCRESAVEAVVGAVGRINDHPLMAAVLEHSPQELTPWMTQRFGATQRQAHDVLRRMIARGQQRTGDGSVRSGDPDRMATTLVLTAQAFVFGNRMDVPEPELRRLVEGYLA